jgi:hypothetical protein
MRSSGKRSLSEAVRAHMRDQADENSRLEELLEDLAKQLHVEGVAESSPGSDCGRQRCGGGMLEEVCNGEFEKKLALM